jgi:hypothetical protein
VYAACTGRCLFMTWFPLILSVAPAGIATGGRAKMSLLDKVFVHPPDNRDFLRWAGNKDDPVGLDALVLLAGKFAFGRAVVVDELSP